MAPHQIAPLVARIPPPESVAQESGMRLPPQNQTVMMRLDDDDQPCWPGWHDGSSWRYADGQLVDLHDAADDATVLDWMHLEDVASMMDVRWGKIDLNRPN